MFFAIINISKIQALSVTVAICSLLLFGCDFEQLNRDASKKIVGIWEGSHENYHWCMEFYSEGKIVLNNYNSARLPKGVTTKQITHWSYIGEWSLGKGRRLELILARADYGDTDLHDKQPNSPTTYIIQEIGKQNLTYLDDHFEKTFVNKRVQQCAPKFSPAE